MKKLLYSIMALAGLTMASCTQEHIDVQYIPENAVAPVLGDIQGCALEDGGADIVVEYTKADFGVATAQVHNLYISTSETMEGMKKAKATFDATTITLKQSDLNITALEFADAGAEVDLYFAIVANLNTDKGAAVAGTELQSNVVKATFKSFVADVLPVEKYGKMYVVGTLNGWDHAAVEKEYDFLYNYDAGNGNLFAGIIDLREPNSAAEFKFTNGAWGDKEHSMDGAQDAEAATVRLVAGGGDNVNVWQTKRFYGAELDLGGTTLKKLWSADQIGIIGDFNGWAEDVFMEYNAKWARFYADVEISADGGLKFRADAGWDLNWGVDCAQGGDNISVAAGKYRVYFNPVTGLIEFNAKKYGTEEDTAANSGNNEEPVNPEQPVQEAGKWGLIGVAGDWNNDIYMYAGEAGKFYSPVVTFEGEFKLRFNNGWDINRGGAFASVGEAFAAEAGGDNVNVPAGTYVVVYDSVAETITMVDALVGWGLIGDGLANGWDGDTYKAFEGEAGVFTAIAYVGEGSFKLRANGGWDTNFGGDFAAFGEPFTAVPGGTNISLGETANTWVIIVLDTNASTITVNNLFANRWGVIGNVNGTSWNADVFMWNNGSVWTSAPFVANGAFKIRKNAGWDENRGGVFAAFDTAFTVEANGADITVGTDVLVTVVYDPAAETITVSEFK